MLNKVEFSDLYKFLTSVGLIFIASAFLIPWLFMKQEIGLTISESEYNGLIESSKVLANNRINLNLFVVKAIPFISGALLILGIIIIYFGISNWKRKQDNVDETELLELTELRTRIQELDSDEIDEKAESEIKEQLKSTDESESEKPDEKKKVEIKKTEQEMEELKSNLIGMEKLFYQKILDYNTFLYEPKSNVKIDNKYEVDIVLNSINHRKNNDIFIEIKYLQNRLSMSIVKDAFSASLKPSRHYTKLTKKSVTHYLILVYKHDIADSKEIQRFVSASRDYINQFNLSNYNLIILSDKEVENFNITTIVK